MEEHKRKSKREHPTAADEFKHKRRKHKKELKSKKKKQRDSSSSPSSSSDSERKRKRKEKKRKKKREKKKNNEIPIPIAPQSQTNNALKETVTGPMPLNIADTSKRAMVPMTKEEYEKQQNKVRRVFDAETGRERLVKGDGEILEEAVSYERHKQINKNSTFGDGMMFQKSLGLNRYTDKAYR